MQDKMNVCIPQMLNTQQSYLLQNKVASLFELGKQPTIKHRLWEVFRSAIASAETDHWSAVERADALFLYDQLIEFFEGIEPIREELVNLRKEVA